MKRIAVVFICLWCSIVVFAQNESVESNALFFACETYDYAGKGIENLDNPIKEANDIEKILRNKFGFKTEIIENPTRQQVIDALRRYEADYRKRAKDPKGQLLIFFTGHGESAGDNGYFLTKDTNPDKDDIPTTAIEYDNVRQIIDELDCQHILVAVDACHSVMFKGDFKESTYTSSVSFADSKGVKSKGGATIKDTKSTPDNNVLSNFRRFSSRIYFTSDANDNLTPDNSDFAEQFKNGLRDFDSKSPFMTEHDLFGYLYKANPHPSKGYFGGKMPEGKFLFFFNEIRNKTEADLKVRKLKVWNSTIKSNTVESFEKFITEFPNSEYVGEAKMRILILDWENAEYKNKIAVYQAFIKKHGDSSPIYKKKAEAAIVKIERENAPIEVYLRTTKVPNGSFQMGGNWHSTAEKYTHLVRVGSFEIGEMEVTFDEYDLFCESTKRKKPLSGKGGRGQMPVVNVSWSDAVAYCNWLSEVKDLQPVYEIGKEVYADFTADGYRLPTEAEWEYAASYSSTGKKYIFGNSRNVADPREINFDGSGGAKKQYSVEGIKRNQPVAVGSLDAPNELGLYDMSGNVSEWCWDRFADDYYQQAATDNPKGPSSDRNFKRVVRGGDYGKGPEYSIVTNRASAPPKTVSPFVGFRIARTTD